MALFLYTAYAKIADHERFLRGLLKVHMISAFAEVIAYAVPAIEIGIALLLLIPRTLKMGLYGFVVIMTSFTIYIIAAMTLETKLPCHCGGAIEKLSWGQHLWFNLAFIAIALFAIRLNNLSTSLKN